MKYFNNWSLNFRQYPAAAGTSNTTSERYCPIFYLWHASFESKRDKINPYSKSFVILILFTIRCSKPSLKIGSINKAGCFDKFRCPRSLALKTSLKSHQMTPFFIQNEDWEQNDVVLIKTLLFCKLNRYHLMTFWWQLKSERTRARGKRNRKSRAHICWTTSFIYQSKFP